MAGSGTASIDTASSTTPLAPSIVDLNRSDMFAASALKVAPNATYIMFALVEPVCEIGCDRTGLAGSLKTDTSDVAV